MTLMAAKIRPQVKKLSGYHLDQPRHRIKLNQNESPYDLPRLLKEQILARLAKIPWNRYPTPYADKLRGKLGKQLKWNPKGILVANGSNVLTQAIVAATAIGGRVMAPDPSFSLYELYGQLFNNRVCKIPLKPDFGLDGKIFERALKKYRPNLTFIPNPNAPTGNLFCRDLLKRIIATSSGMIVIDEAYYPFSGETLIPILKKNPHMLILRTMSKAFSLGGARVGYLVGNPKVIQEIRKVLPPFCLNVLSATVAESVLDSPKYIDKIVSEITRERKKIYEALEALPGIDPFPSDANFILFRAKKPKVLFNGLLKAGILIRDVSDSGPLKNCLRVTIGTPMENRAFIHVIEGLALRFM